MNARVFLLLPVCWLLLTAAPVRAVIVFEKGRDQPTVGHLVRQDERSVVIRQSLANGNSVQREIPRSQIDQLLIVVSEERLAGLRPDQPSAYRDYAEELAEKRRDPDALATSRKLFLIAAHLDPDRLGRSCLLGLAGLAPDRDQQRKFRAMAYLLDPNHDRSLLAPEAAAGGGRTEDSGRAVLLKAVQAFRRGDRALAMTLAKRPVVRQALARFADVLAYEDFTDAKKNTSDAILRKVLVLELLLTRPNDPVRQQANRPNNPWSRIVLRDGSAPVPSLRLETLTDFDPRNCVFRNGAWTRP